jgi:hypothetical protein
LLIGVKSESLVIQLITRQIRCSIVKSLITTGNEIAQGALPPAEVIINSESLFVLIKSSKLPQER